MKAPSKITTTTVAHSHITGVKVLSVHTIPSKVAVGKTFTIGRDRVMSILGDLIKYTLLLDSL